MEEGNVHAEILQYCRTYFEETSWYCISNHQKITLGQIIEALDIYPSLGLITGFYNQRKVLVHSP